MENNNRKQRGGLMGIETPKMCMRGWEKQMTCANVSNH